jgi:hypothetical protein
MTGMALFLLLVTASLGQAFYLPGVNPRSFAEGEQ